MTKDAAIAYEFFAMLERNGVTIEYTSDGGPGFKIISFHDKETIEVCFHSDGSYWRIMGTDETGFYSDDIHK